jgi:hypothetical protein
MNKKFASRFKSEEDSAFYSDEPVINEINNKPDENSYEYKLNKMTFFFPSIPKEKIEQILNDNKEISLQEGIEMIKQMIITKNKRNETNNNRELNNINNINYSKKRIKRNYISSLIQSKKQTQSPLINNMNNINNMNTINNMNAINNINNKIEVNSRTDIFSDESKEKVKEEERQKFELKTVDKITEEILESKNQEDLKQYLFNQLVLLDDKKDKDKKIQELIERIDNLEKDRTSLAKCLHTIIRPVNKNTCKINKLDNKIKELNDDIVKVSGNIKYLEYMGNLFLNMIEFKKMDLN